MSRHVGSARRHLVLLAALVVMLALQPWLARVSATVSTLCDGAFAALYVVLLLSLCREGWERRAGIGLALPGIASILALHATPSTATAVAFHVSLIVYLSFGVTVVLRVLSRTSVIHGDDVLGAVSGYILAGLAWGHVYALTYILAPASFGVNPAIATQLDDWHLRRTLLDYLSFTTLTSIGYDDITPAGPPMYTLTWLETMFGQFYMAVVVAQLVGLKLAQAVRGDGPAPR